MAARDQLCPILRLDSPAPAEMIPSMVSLPVDQLVPGAELRLRLELILRERHHIEIPFLRWRPSLDSEAWAIRVSCQVCNKAADIDVLADALTDSIQELEL